MIESILQEARREAFDEIEQQLIEKKDFSKLKKLREMRDRSDFNTTKLGGISS